MKIVELVNKVQLPISNEEADILGRFVNTPKIEKKEFNLREQTIANQLVNKDVLLRKNENGQIYYKKKI